MNLQEFCKPFDKPTYGLNGIRSKEKIVSFFVTLAYGYDPQYDGSYYRRWFNGAEFRHWDDVTSLMDIERFSNKLRQCFNRSVTNVLCNAFGIALENDDNGNEYAFSYALAVQFKDIAIHRGEADNNIKKYYDEYIRSHALNECDTGDVYKNYIRKAIKSYKWMNIQGGDEGELQDYYVCNTLSFNSPYMTASKSGKTNEAIIEEASLEKLMNYRKNRTGVNNNYSILIGNGGIGKTLMLQHLFIESAEKYLQTGFVPVLISLRDVIFEDDGLVPCVTRAFKHFDETITQADIEELMKEGRCQLLLDGLDEIDEREAKQFQRQLKETIDKYDEIQVVIATRECNARKGIGRFSRFYLIEFNQIQMEQLIDNLLEDEGTGEEKNQILDFIYGGFLGKNSVFIKNPMLLTFIVTNRNKLQSFKKSRYDFYEQAYKMVLEGHDADKNAYSRIFHSVDDAEDFTTVFREFCAISYMDGVFQFDNDSFEEYFKKLKTVEELPNKNKIKKASFYYDACASACMMYEENSKILYIDPGFQEYLFAAYYRSGNTSIGKAVGKTLMQRSLTDYKNRNAINMLLESSEEKMEICLFKPFLDTVFRGSDDEQAFVNFITSGYDSLHYTVINEPLLIEYQKKSRCDSSSRVECINEPKSVILSMILEKLGASDTFSLAVEESTENYNAYRTMSIIADKRENESILSMRTVSMQEFDKRDDFEKGRNVEDCIRDDNGQIVCFGHEYEVDTYAIGKNKDSFIGLLSMFKAKNEVVANTFEILKNYYSTINRRQNKNRFK